jgi:uncharacterized protein (TIGR02147 family)
MVNAFDYTDYQKYLADYYNERKKQNHGFSYQSLAQKAGFGNAGFVYNIFNGKCPNNQILAA